jgi:hypothetical protein
MMLLPQESAGYIAIPKTASISMNAWLARHFSVKNIKVHHSYDVPDEHLGLMWFTIVREPRARLLSFWRHTMPHGRTSFRDFMKQAIKHSRSPAPGAAPWFKRNQTDIIHMAGVLMVLKFEMLPHCLSTLPFVDARQSWLFPHENPTQTDHQVHKIPPHSVDDIDDETAALIWEHSGPDFERFDYPWRLGA